MTSLAPAHLRNAQLAAWSARLARVATGIVVVTIATVEGVRALTREPRR